MKGLTDSQLMQLRMRGFALEGANLVWEKNNQTILVSNFNNEFTLVLENEFKPIIRKIKGADSLVEELIGLVEKI